jgi:SulP family sulfate permease
MLRLGFAADFISAPVLAGFKAGTGLLIAAGQLGKILGIPQRGDGFFAKVGSALAHLGELSWPTFALALASMSILLGLRRWGPPWLPGPLLVVALGVLLAVTTGLADRGVALVGTIPPGLPQLALPDPELVGRLVGPAAGIALMAFVESIAAARAFTGPGEPEADADQELRALGAANLAGGCFQASPGPTIRPSRCSGAGQAAATGATWTATRAARPSLGCWCCGRWPRSTSPTPPGSGGGCSTWSTRSIRPRGSCCWTWTPSPTSTSPPWTWWPPWTPNWSGAASSCG